MRLKSLELGGFKSFGKKTFLDFDAPISAIVGPNGSGKSNVAEAFRFVLGEQSIKSLRGKKGEDLIFNGGKDASRSNRASVKVVFDNSGKLFDVDFDEVSIERVVHRDGVNQYLISGSQVRLRDIIELLAGANIGSSGHHIISQGEADHILNANPKERREMIEDALGLKVYHYKLIESEKKLQKTRNNIEQVEALRKEIAPHLRFLKRQVTKVEKAREMRNTLKELYREYLKRESVYLSWWQHYIKGEKVKPERELGRLDNELNEAKEVLEREHKNDAKSQEIIDLEAKLRTLREEKDTHTRELGRLEGEQSALKRSEEQRERNLTVQDERMVRLGAVKNITREIKETVKRAEGETAIETLRSVLQNVISLLHDFVEREETRSSVLNETMSVGQSEERKALLEKEYAALEATLVALEKEEEELQRLYETLKREIESVRDKSREAERMMFSIMSKQNEQRVILQELLSHEQELVREHELFERELEEAALLVGRAVLQYEEFKLIGNNEDVATEDREEQEKRRREIEKIKIRLEEYGSGSGEEIMKEYEELDERNQFLEREIVDLQESAESLKKIMAELEEKLSSRFKEGIAKINQEFGNFFSLMFGGGSASLSVLRASKRREKSEALLEESIEGLIPEEEPEEGIEIAVSLPHKRIKGLVMLSGGERALTSIALLFAMSQVNPPPFLILDETDAALDEANSKRYGDMIENLSKYSQLILITHNRETMSRAHLLYGITMGGNGVSKLLSVKFDEAVIVSK